MNSEANLKRPQFLNVKELADMLRTKQNHPPGFHRASRESVDSSFRQS
jgi:hypothetical protein